MHKISQTVNVIRNGQVVGSATLDNGVASPPKPAPSPPLVPAVGAGAAPAKPKLSPQSHPYLPPAENLKIPQDHGPSLISRFFGSTDPHITARNNISKLNMIKSMLSAGAVTLGAGAVLGGVQNISRQYRLAGGGHTLPNAIYLEVDDPDNVGKKRRQKKRSADDSVSGPVPAPTPTYLQHSLLNRAAYAIGRGLNVFHRTDRAPNPMQEVFAPNSSTPDFMNQSWAIPLGATAAIGGGALGYKGVIAIGDMLRERALQIEINKEKKKYEEAIKRSNAVDTLYDLISSEPQTKKTSSLVDFMIDSPAKIMGLALSAPLVAALASGARAAQYEMEEGKKENPRYIAYKATKKHVADYERANPAPIMLIPKGYKDKLKRRKSPLSVSPVDSPID